MSEGEVRLAALLVLREWTGGALDALAHRAAFNPLIKIIKISYLEGT